MRRRHLTGVVAGLALAAPTAVVATPALADGTTNFVVTVNDDDNCCDGLAGATVQLYSTSTGVQVGTTATSDSAGRATFAVGAGSYTAKVVKTGYYAEYSTVTAVTADEVTNADEVDAYVYLDSVPKVSGKLHGKVTTDGGPFTDFGYVVAFDTSNGDFAGLTYVSPQTGGQWGLKLQPGSYKIEVYDFISGTWQWIGGDDMTTATTYAVTAGADLTAATVNLSSASSTAHPTVLTGKVTDSSGKGIAGITVDLYSSTATEEGDWTARSVTDATGAYSFADDQNGNALAAGDYRLGFSDSNALTEYGSAFYAGSAAPVADPADGTIPSGAASVSVTGTEAATASTVALSRVAVPAQTSGVHGVVTTDAGTPVVGAEVDVTSNATGWNTYVYTGRDGSWSIDGEDLPPGTYSAYVSPDDDIAIGKSFKLTLPVKGIGDAGTVTLARYGSISGKVTLAGHTDRPFTDVGVEILDVDGDSVSYDDIDVESSGAYTITGLEPGSYTVEFSGERYPLYGDESSVEYIQAFYGGAADVAGAKAVPVRSGAWTRNVNGTLTHGLTPVVAPSIVGTAKVGSTLTARPGTWTKKVGTRISYVWKVGARVVSRAASYKIADAYAGKTVTVTVTASNPRWDSGSVTRSTNVAKVVEKHKKKRKKKKK